LSGHSVAVVGDGAMAEGLLLEALNHASAEGSLPLVIVLNDNGFAISPGFGAIHNYLQTLNVGSDGSETLFTALGYSYTGPIDGHDVAALCEAFDSARDSNGPVSVVHVKTEKGRGLPPAATHPYRMHFSFPFDVESGALLTPPVGVGAPDVAASVILEQMRTDETIVCITPSTRYATGLDPVFEAVPERCFDPGMAEQHAMTLGVGLWLAGRHPVLAYQSTFMQRAYDQIFHDVCFMNVPALILSARVGFAGYDNPTHHGLYETSYIHSLPNLRVMYPKDGYELERMTREALGVRSGPVLIEMPYGPVDFIDRSVLEVDASAFSTPETIEVGDDVVLISIGPRFRDAMTAQRMLSEQGLSCGLVNLRYLKPLPEDALIASIGEAKRVVTIEEGLLDGGVGAAVAAMITDRGLHVELLRIGIPSTFVEPGSLEELSRAYGVDADSIVARVAERWGLGGR